MSDKLLEAITACLNDPAFQSGSMNEVFRVVPSRLWEAIEDAYMVAKAESAAQQAVIKAAREFVAANRAVMSRDTKGFDAFSAACDRVMAAQKALRDALAALDSQGGGC